ncbi:uncharacterized protein LOC131951731 isoform X2 [Physella acuta]|uniref:uncharacterized protein LOC131951731 isoform X2 n=1 Tax=Physella acuta TaxID=109671 RepID=UPI0027DBA0C2|nr:uncharacterized protein LOC131951731 isoform X2 [Physella acuta]
MFFFGQCLFSLYNKKIMLLRVLRSALVLLSSAVVIPYTIAIVSNILHGWPQSKYKYRRALSPRKVYGLNYVLFQMLRDKTKFLTLYFKWRKFYKKADPSKLYKNIAFGRNDCTLDVYLPGPREACANLPVVIFVYGGAWSSGDKSSYGLLCSNIVSHTQSIAVCPNYSTYPKGYVDDMIQDIVDCISWVIDNIQDYGGDKNKIILLGHSAGAHLSMMAILELLHDERLSVQPSFKFTPAGGPLELLDFADSHYNVLDRRREGLEDSSGSSESFAVVSENGSSLEQSTVADSGSNHFSNSSQEKTRFETEKSCVRLETDSSAGGDAECLLEKSQAAEAVAEDEAVNVEARSRSHSGSQGDDEDDESGDNDSVITVRPKDIDRHATLVDMCKAVKAFIGLAGVYSIGDHFKHEWGRGIEDISCMCRAHYGEDHFVRFSPKEIILSLGRCLSLPVMVLVHGVNDYVSPMSASTSFGQALSEISANVQVKLIPECNHYQVCLDLMDANSTFYSHVMGTIMETIRAVS